MIGGSFRKIAGLYLQYTRYPLNILHRLRISTSSFLWYISKLEVSKNEENNTENPYKKSDNFHISITLARALIELFSPEYIIISTYGLKEGVRFYHLSDEEKKKNPIYESIKFNKNIEDPIFISYKKLLSPLLIYPNEQLMEVMELSMLMINNNLMGGVSEENISEFILNSEIPFSHYQRIMISLIAAILYNGKIENKLYMIAKKLLNRQDYNNARILGNLFKICYDIDGPVFIDPSFEIIMRDKFWHLSIERSIPKTIFLSACQSLKAAAFIQKGGLHNY
jgi:exopolyphosphatase/guanosine-5'-triphosphate,3'-diphosphate pyrophosphatase